MSNGSIRLLADGRLPTAKTALYEAPPGGRVRVTLVTFVNGDSVSRAVNLYINANGVGRHIIPKSLTLGAGWSMETDADLFLNSGDLLEGDAAAANVVDYTIHGTHEQ